MKKLLVLILAISVLAGAAMAASFSNIGYIDVQKVFRDYKETSKAQEELGKKEEAFKKEFEESQKKLEKAEKDGKEPSELQR